MHCHLIVSRKDQANKKKLSPLTNHKNTTNGVIKGGFDCVKLIQQAEQGFDRLYGYDRQHYESFDYHNTMKNGSISEQLELQQQDFQHSERKIEVNQGSSQKNLLSINLRNEETIGNHKNKQISNSFISFLSFGTDIPANQEEQILKPKKKKRIRR